MLKKLIPLLFLLTVCNITLGQEIESVLNAPDNWPSEIIPFPIGFAQEIDYVGFEDLRFTPAWRDSTSNQFWTYTFVWYVDKGPDLTVNNLASMMNVYYDGLMKIDWKNRMDSTKVNQIDKTHSEFVKSDDGFTGTVRTFDNFTTQKYMTLNFKVSASFCARTNKQIITFEISPKSFDHPIWQIFDAVDLIVDCD